MAIAAPMAATMATVRTSVRKRFCPRATSMFAGKSSSLLAAGGAALGAFAIPVLRKRQSATTPLTETELTARTLHRRAVEVSPGHYHHVRLHKGSIPGRLLDEGDITIERTKYFDFDTGNGTWFGLREF